MNRSFIRRIAAGFLSLSLLLSLPAWADDGRPQLESLSLGRETVSPGGRISLEGQAWAGEGEMGPIQLYFQEESSGRVLMGVLRETRDTGEGPPPSPADYSGTLAVPADAPLGEYRLFRVSLRDSSGGFLRLEKAPSSREGWEVLDWDLAFTVVETAAPSSPAAVTLSPARAQPGDTVTVTVSSQGESPLRGASLLFREEGGSHSLACSLQETDGWVDPYTLSGELTLPQGLPSGNYSLCSLTLTDASGARQTYSSQEGEDLLPLPVAAVLTVTGDSGDTTPPVLDALSLGEPSREDGSWVWPVTVTARDTGSGLDHITLRFEQGEESVSTVLYGNGAESGSFQGEITVTAASPAGTYTLAQATLADQVGNRSYYQPADDCSKRAQPLPQLLTLSVPGTGAGDEEAPALLSLTLEEHRIQTGEAILVTARTEDDGSPAQKVELQFRNEGGRSIAVTLEPDRSGRLTGWVKKYQTETAGRYRLVKAAVTDQAGNRRVYRQEPGRGEEPLPFSTGFWVEE